MKKGVLVLVLCCFLLVGCGKTTPTKNETNNKPKEDTKKTSLLVCSMDTKHTVNFNTEMAFSFENDVPVKLGVRYSYDLSSYTEEQRNAFAKAKMCETDSIKNTLEMTDCQEGLVGTDYIVKGYSEKMLRQAMASPSVLKSTYETQGWTCTLK